MAYSLQEKLEILNFAKDHGINAAAAHFGVTGATITLWNKQLKLFLLPEINYVTDCNQELRINFSFFFAVLCTHTKMQHDLRKNLQSTEKSRQV